MKTREFIAVVVLALGIMGTVAAWVLWPDEGAESQAVVDPLAVSSILQQLAPGTTLHTVDVVYRRHGLETPPEAEPETLRTEAWAEFDETGALAAYRSETRNAADDTIFQTAALDGDDLVIHDADGTEGKRIADFRLGLTVDSLNARIAEAITKAADALAARPDAQAAEVDGQSVVVLEDRRRLPAAEEPIRPFDNEVTGYSLPYVADLKPAEEVRRDYILPDASRGLKSEVVIVDADGTETVVESREHRVFEVLPSVVSTPATAITVLPPTTPTPVPPAEPTPVQAALFSNAAAVGPYTVPLVSYMTSTAPATLAPIRAATYLPYARG